MRHRIELSRIICLWVSCVLFYVTRSVLTGRTRRDKLMQVLGVYTFISQRIIKRKKRKREKCMEIRIKLTKDEFENIEMRAKAAELPTVNAYARDLLFPTQNLAAKWKEIKSRIADLASEEEFYIKDFMPNAPSLLGRWAYEQQHELEIEFVEKDRTGTNIWRKL